MDRRWIARLLCAAAIVCSVTIVPTRSIAQTSSYEQCAPSAFTRSAGDLRVVLDRRRIAFSGTVARIDEVTLRRELAKVLDASGSLNGRPVCLLLRTDLRRAGYVTASIRAVVSALGKVSSSANFRAMWGGGGLTVVGWMTHDDKETIQSLASVRFPLDAQVIGLIEDLPSNVNLRVEGVNLTSNRVLQIEQFHPKAGLITLSTTSKVPLRACPGGWRGKTPAATWASPVCVTVQPGKPTVLPDPGNNQTHLSLAIRPARGSSEMIDVKLRYTAVDQAFECYLGGSDHICTLLPPRFAT